MRFRYTFTICLLSLMLFANGCSANNARSLPGKFIFSSIRSSTVEHPRGSLYMVKKGKMSKIADDFGGGKWSADGKEIICLHNGGIAIITEKGEMKRTIETPQRASSVDASSDLGFVVYIAYEKKEYKKHQDYIYIYDMKNDVHTPVYKPELQTTLSNIQLSPDNKKILFNESVNVPARKPMVRVLDISSGEIKTIWEYASSASWFPDSQHVLFSTNSDEKGDFINKVFGALMKVDIETLDYEILREQKSADIAMKVSEDGNYIYYSKPSQREKGGQYIVVSPIDKPNNEIVVTKPVAMTHKGTLLTYSQDTNDDWYQGE